MAPKPMPKESLAVLQNELKHVQAQLGLILKETRATNGRIRKLELWRSFLAGAMAAVTFAVSYLLH